MSVGTALLAIFFSFIIGVVFGGMAAFLSRRLMFNRQIRIAERNAARLMGDTREEAKKVLSEAREETSNI
ncbi:MAG: hypothetical protein V3R36_02260 [Dehalococcoidales bacterium]